MSQKEIGRAVAMAVKNPAEIEQMGKGVQENGEPTVRVKIAAGG